MEDESMEGLEDESMEAEPVAVGREARNRRQRPRLKTREASFSGGLGKSGRSALPSNEGGTEDYKEDYTVGKKDRSTSGTGKSYKLKTSVGATNKPVHPKVVRKLVHEANRRISALENGISRLRESNRGKERVINRYQGIISYHNSKIQARRLLESAVNKGWFGRDEEGNPTDSAAGFARSVEPRLYGLNKDKQIQEIRIFARLRESTASIAEDSAIRMMEGVEGVGARGGAVSRGSTVDRNSELEEAMSADGIPFREEE